MVGQASSLSINNDGQDARRHEILFLFSISFENPYSPAKRGWTPDRRPVASENRVEAGSLKMPVATKSFSFSRLFSRIAPQSTGRNYLIADILEWIIALAPHGLICPSVSKLLASRMDALIVGRRFIAGTNGADRSGSPVRDD